MEDGAQEHCTGQKAQHAVDKLHLSGNGCQSPLPDTGGISKPPLPPTHLHITPTEKTATLSFWTNLQKSLNITFQKAKLFTFIYLFGNFIQIPYFYKVNFKTHL